MISPLDIEVVVGAEYVHNLVGIRTTIEHIAEDVKLVDGELLNKVADGNYEVVGTVDIDDGADDYIYISLLVRVESRLVEQLLNDIREIVGQGFADFGSRIFRRHASAHSHKPVDGDEIPVLYVGSILLYQFEFQLGVIDKRAKFLLVVVAEGSVIYFAHFALDGA